MGKVLAVDLIDTDKFENHFLLTVASLGAQLLKTYDLGVDKNGNNNIKYSNIINLPSSYKSKYIVINYKFLYRIG